MSAWVQAAHLKVKLLNTVRPLSTLARLRVSPDPFVLEEVYGRELSKTLLALHSAYFQISEAGVRLGGPLVLGSEILTPVFALYLTCSVAYW